MSRPARDEGERMDMRRGTAACESPVDRPAAARNSCALSRRALLGGAASLLAAPAVRAQTGMEDWPPERVTIVTSLPAGSTVDLISRIFADKLAQLWGQPVIVDNRGGGNGVLACQIVA